VTDQANLFWGKPSKPEAGVCAPTAENGLSVTVAQKIRTEHRLPQWVRPWCESGAEQVFASEVHSKHCCPPNAVMLSLHAFMPPEQFFFVQMQ
jgi:hypothetical protein